MFNHRNDLQFSCRPTQPDGRYAVQLGRLLADQHHEIGVATHYLDHGWSVPVSGRYRDQLIQLGVDQVAMIEMLATMIARLLEGAPAAATEQVLRSHPAVAAVLGGTDLERALETVPPSDNPWQHDGTSARNNLVADYQLNAAAENGRRPVVRLLQDRTDDAQVRLLLRCLAARTEAHRQDCVAAVMALTEEPDERVYPGGRR
jgi:Mn-containing catalase